MTKPFKFSETSNKRLNLCHPDLKRVACTALSLGIIDFMVVEGHRDQATQDRFYSEGKSKVKYPYGKHNKIPSEAYDLAPVVDGKLSWDQRHCLVLAGVIIAVGAMEGVNIRWGGNWDQDGEPVTDQDFQDLVHFELSIGVA